MKSRKAGDAEKPYILVSKEEEAEEAEKKFLQSRDLHLEFDEPKFSPPTPGPQTTTGSPLQELARIASAAELSEFVEVIRERHAAAESCWLQCDNPKCHFVGVFRARLAGQNCAKCNWNSRTDLGHLRPMSEAAVAEYQKMRAAKDAQNARRYEAAALEARNDERRKSGLPALSLEQFRRAGQKGFTPRIDPAVARGQQLRRERLSETAIGRAKLAEEAARDGK